MLLRHIVVLVVSLGFVSVAESQCVEKKKASGDVGDVVEFHICLSGAKPSWLRINGVNGGYTDFPRDRWKEDWFWEMSQAGEAVIKYRIQSEADFSEKNIVFLTRPSFTHHTVYIERKEAALTTQVTHFPPITSHRPTTSMTPRIPFNDTCKDILETTGELDGEAFFTICIDSRARLGRYITLRISDTSWDWIERETERRGLYWTNETVYEKTAVRLKFEISSVEDFSTKDVKLKIDGVDKRYNLRIQRSGESATTTTTPATTSTTTTTTPATTSTTTTTTTTTTTITTATTTEPPCPVQPGTDQCPERWYPLTESSCFTVFGPKDFKTAKETCEENNSDLVSVSQIDDRILSCAGKSSWWVKGDSTTECSMYRKKQKDTKPIACSEARPFICVRESQEAELSVTSFTMKFAGSAEYETLDVLKWLEDKNHTDMYTVDTKASRVTVYCEGAGGIGSTTNVQVREIGETGPATYRSSQSFSWRPGTDCGPWKTFWCRVKGKTNTVLSRNITLAIPCSTEIASFSTKKQPKLNQRLALMCIVKSYPPPTSIKLLKEPSEVLDKTSKRNQLMYDVDSATCGMSGKYWCEAVSTEGHMVRKSAIVAIDRCPPVWLINQNHSSTHNVGIEKRLQFNVDVISSASLYVAKSLVDRNHAGLQSTSKIASIELTTTISTYPLFTVSVEITPKTEEDFGNWSLKIPNYRDTLTDYSDWYNFSVVYEGPPVFCKYQDRQKPPTLTLTASFGFSTNASVCILSPKRHAAPIPTKDHSASSKPENSSFHTLWGSRPGGQLSQQLILQVARLSEGDIGHWTVTVGVDDQVLSFRVNIKATGPAVLCPNEPNDKEVYTQVDKTAIFSTCLLSPTNNQPFEPTVSRYSAKKQSLQEVRRSSRTQFRFVRSLDHPLRFNMNLSISNIQAEDFGQWSLIFKAYDTSEEKYKSTTIRFLIKPKGPPVFCDQQQRHNNPTHNLKANLFAPGNISVCLMIQDNQSKDFNISAERLTKRPDKGETSPYRSTSYQDSATTKRRSPYTRYNDRQRDVRYPRSTSDQGLTFKATVEQRQGRVLEHDLTLSVSSLSETDIGLWTVFISNNFGTLAVNVEVEATGPPALCPTERKNRTVSAVVGQALDFSVCILSPDKREPYQEIIYQYSTEHERYTEKSNRFVVEPSKVDGHEIRYSLLLSTEKILAEDFGLWRFVAQFLSSSRQRHELVFSFVIKPEGLPECPTDLKVKSVGSHFVSLGWRPGHDGGAEQEFVVLVNDSIALSNSISQGTGPTNWYRLETGYRYDTANVTGLQADTGYMFRVVAVNRFGPDVGEENICSDFIEVKTDEPQPMMIEGPTNSGDVSSGSNAGLIAGIFIIILIIAFIVLGIIVYKKRDTIFKRNNASVRIPLTKTREESNTENVYANQSSIRETNQRQLQDDDETVIFNPVYVSSADVEQQNDKDPNEGRYMNEEGLVYVTIDFNSIPKDNRQSQRRKLERSRKESVKPDEASPNSKDFDTFIDGLAPEIEDRVEYTLLDYEQTGKLVVPDELPGEEESPEVEPVYANEVVVEKKAQEEPQKPETDAKAT